MSDPRCSPKTTELLRELRLVASAGDLPPKGHPGLAARAADEIERLEFEYELADQSAKRLGAKWKQAIEEIERLRGVAQAPRNPAADLVRVFAVTNLTEKQDVEFFLAQWFGCQNADDRVRLIRSFRNQLINAGASEMASSVPSTDSLCAKCGCETKGEAALVDGQIWCHPCADDHSVSSKQGNTP
jgi:hypothetical protein